MDGRVYSCEIIKIQNFVVDTTMSMKKIIQKALSIHFFFFSFLSQGYLVFAKAKSVITNIASVAAAVSCLLACACVAAALGTGRLGS